MSIWVSSASCDYVGNKTLWMYKKKRPEQDVLSAAPPHVPAAQGCIPELWAGKQEESPVILTILYNQKIGKQKNYKVITNLDYKIKGERKKSVESK